MPGPLISEIHVSPNPVPVGQNATITVVASDPDGRQIVAEALVADPSGQSATVSFVFDVSDALHYAVSMDSGVVTRDATDPTVFVWSPEGAPA
jgi:hypothetical protein